MTLSSRARQDLRMLFKRAKGHSYLFLQQSDGEQFHPDGKKVKTSSGVSELIEQKVVIPNEDGLFPGMSQTYSFNPKVNQDD